MWPQPRHKTNGHVENHTISAATVATNQTYNSANSTDWSASLGILPNPITQYSNQYHHHYNPHDLHSMRQQQPDQPPPPYRYPAGAGSLPGMQWSDCMASHYGVGPTNDMRMQNVLPPAAPRQTEATGQAAAAVGCCGAADGGAGYYEAAGFEDAGADLHCAQDAWQRLLEDLRGAGEPALCGGGEERDDEGASDLRDDRGAGGGDRKRSRGNGDISGGYCNDYDDGRATADDELPPFDSYDDSSDNEEAHGSVVEVQPSDRVLLPQGNRETCTALWVVNSTDWIDVEHVLRRMLRCESSECHDFYSIGYVFFRSCAVSHVASPSDFLKDGVHYRFPGTGVGVAIKRVHAEGVLEVECYFEYMP